VARKPPKTQAPSKEARPVGRPTDYREEYAEQARKLCLLGATDKELADFFHVEEKTINNWKAAHPGFLQSIVRGKDLADAEVAASLYKRATGMTVKETRMSGGGDDEGPAAVETIKEIPPDTQAASLWLRNRQAAKWRDKTEQDVKTTAEVVHVYLPTNGR